MMMPVLGTGNLNAQKLFKNSSFDILTKWEGKWKSNRVFEKSVWITERVETRGTIKTNWHLYINNLSRVITKKT